MQPRDLKILHHIGLYRVSIREVIEHCYFGGRNCGNVLQRLRDDNLIEEAAKLKDGFRCYKLGPKGEAAAGLSVRQEGGPQWLQTALGTLWFCHIDTTKDGKPTWRDPPKPPRQPTRLLSEISPSESVSGMHCIQAEAERSRLFRLYVPAPQTPISRALRELEDQIERATTHPDLAAWVWSRAYAFAVLLDNQVRQEEFERQVKQRGLHEKAYLLVQYAPGPESLKGAIDALRSQAP